MFGEQACHLIILYLVADDALDCTIYSNELDIINLNPFFVRPQLSVRTTSVFYDDTLKQVRQMVIFDDKNPWSNVFCLKNLQQLTLSNTNLTLLPEIRNLQKLTVLKIDSDNGATGEYLPGEIGELKSLATLELTNIRNLKSIPVEIEQLTSLKALTLAQIPNLLCIAPSHLGQLTNLTVLNLIDLPQVQKLPQLIENFQQLTQLTVTNTIVPSLELRNMPKLNTVKVSSNSVLDFIEVVNVTLLNTLEISRNAAAKTLLLQNLPALQFLTISSNPQLNSIIAENLTALRSWTVSSALSLETLTLLNTTVLSAVTFSSNPKLQSVLFENSPNLGSITLTGSSLLSTLLFINTPMVTQLDLSSCQLTSFPSSILGLTLLQTLNLQSNQLSSLPSTLSTDLPNLQVLTLDFNQFRGAIMQPPLIYVRELYVRNNSLTTLDGIGEYRSLQKISLTFNQITSFPLEIMKLSPVLRYINIASNPLTTILYQMTNMRALSEFYAMQNRMTQAEKIYVNRLFSAVSMSYNFQ